jgi:hypothetical protein
LVGLVVASCALPAFDLQLILADQARAKMDEIASIDSVEAFGDIDLTGSLFFVPSRMRSPDHGILMLRHSLGYEALYVRFDPVDQAYRSGFYQEWRFFDDEPENQYPVALPVTDTSGTYTDLYFVAMPDVNEVDMHHTTHVYDASVPDFYEATGSPSELGAVALALDITGQGAFPQLRVIHTTVTPGEIRIEAEQFVDGKAAPINRYTAGFVTLPDGAEPADGRLAYQFSTDTYVYSFTTGGESFTAYSWVGTGTPRKLDSDRRIDEILENGDLYSRGDSTDVVYDADGKVKHELKTGALYFSHERIDPDGSVLVYSLVYRSDSNDERVSIGVYEIALSDIGSLE